MGCVHGKLFLVVLDPAGTFLKSYFSADKCGRCSICQLFVAVETMGVLERFHFLYSTFFNMVLLVFLSRLRGM